LAQFVRISHDMTDDAPCWPGTPKLVRRQFTSLDKGDVSNTCDLLLFNHFGTHLDAPNHYNPHGPTLEKVPLDRFIYEHPLLVDIPKRDQELVTRQELEPYAAQLRDSDLILIRSGWGNLRGTLRTVTQPKGQASGLKLALIFSSFLSSRPWGWTSYRSLPFASRIRREPSLIRSCAV